MKASALSFQEPKSASIAYDFLNRFPTLEPVRMFHEALSLIQAGSDPVATACLIGFFHVLRNPSVHALLKRELNEAFPDPTDNPTWSDLERIPYLVSLHLLRLCHSFDRSGTQTAVIKESLRMSHGFVSAIPRIVGPCGAELAGYYIPPKVRVDHSTDRL